MYFRLKILQGLNEGKEIAIRTTQCVIGREEGCDLRINNDSIGHKHCVIVSSKSESVIRDLNSRDGTFVNDQRIARDVVLLNGDILKVGPYLFKVIIERTRPKA
jgi:pSer/pThr/pTyr-binding forkhead associated (FHA) protein